MRLTVRILAPIFLLFGLIGPAGVANAAPAESQRNFAFVLVIHQCGQEIVRGEGFAHLVTKPQGDGSSLARFNIHGKGVGNLGNEYVVNTTVTQLTFTGEIAGTTHTRAISKGSAPNQDVYVTFNTATGEFFFERTCHG